MYRGEPPLKRQVWQLWAEGQKAKEISVKLDISMGTAYKWIADLKRFSPQELAYYYPNGSIPDIVLDKWKYFHSSIERDEFEKLSPTSPDRYRFSLGPSDSHREMIFPL